MTPLIRLGRLSLLFLKYLLFYPALTTQTKKTINALEALLVQVVRIAGRRRRGCGTDRRFVRDGGVLAWDPLS